MKKIIDLMKKYKEFLLYVIFGGLTTVVNFIVFAVCCKVFGEKFYLVSNAIAWFVSVVFAYITNKLFVFDSKSLLPKVLLKEISAFFSARILSFAIEEGGMWLLIDALGVGGHTIGIFGFSFSGQLIAKLVMAVIVVITNYFASKFLIFRKKKQ